MLCAVLVRRLREGASVEDFIEAWRPDEAFSMPAKVVTARSLSDPREIVSVGYVDLPAEQLPAALAEIAESEAKRHDRIAAVIEATVHKAIYEIVDEADLGPGG